MPVSALVSAEEYLATSYRPDREFVDGEILERTLGEFDHGDLQGEIVAFLRSHSVEWKIRAIPELRIKVGPTRYRIPDVCVLWRHQPREPVLTSPPLVCIEVLSKDDSLRGMQDRVDDYLNFGVPHVWILDPLRRRSYVCTASSFESAVILRVPGTPIHLSMNELFENLDLL